MENLPTEIIMDTYLKLNRRDLRNVCRANKKMENICNDKYFISMKTKKEKEFFNKKFSEIFPFLLIVPVLLVLPVRIYQPGKSEPARGDKSWYNFGI